MNAVLLRPMPFPESDRLVQLFSRSGGESFPGIKRFAVSPGNYLDCRALGKSFDGMAAYAPLGEKDEWLGLNLHSFKP